MERIDKILVSQNICSRKEAGQMIRKGRVQVNGQIITSPQTKVDPDTAQISVDGSVVAYRKYLYLMMYKPTGVLSATEDNRQKTVLDLVPPQLYRKGLFPAGRLDKDTTGLLILTDDGDYAHRMLSPKKHVYKIYQVETELPVTPQDQEKFLQGVSYGEIQYAPAQLFFSDPSDQKKTTVKIREGKFHQVKRMFEACGNRVVHLHRSQIGALCLDDFLKPGQVRVMEKEEADTVFSSPEEI